METDDTQLFQYSTPQQNNSFKRPRRSLQSSTPLSSVTESTSPSPRLSGHAASLTPDVIEHINGLKHLDDKSILLLLEAARSGGQYCRPRVCAVGGCGCTQTVCLPYSRSHAHDRTRQVFYVDARKQGFFLPQRSIQQSERAIRPEVLHRFYRLIFHSLQRCIVQALYIV